MESNKVAIKGKIRWTKVVHVPMRQLTMMNLIKFEMLRRLWPIKNGFCSKRESKNKLQNKNNYMKKNKFESQK